MADRSDYCPDLSARSAFLDESVQDLVFARRTFQRLPDGDRAAQVSDTDALLSRTFLVRREFEKASQRLAQARLLGPAVLKKTAFDCLILEDELQVARTDASISDLSAATSGIQAVIDATNGPGYEHNEIRARALLAKAKIFAFGHAPYYQELNLASEIYDQLGDRNACAQLKLWHLKRGGRLLPELASLLAPYPPIVQIRAFETYVETYGSPSLAAASINRVRDSTDPRWAAIIRLARQTSAHEVEVYR
jgi:hypothetical protein